MFSLSLNKKTTESYNAKKKEKKKKKEKENKI